MKSPNDVQDGAAAATLNVSSPQGYLDQRRRIVLITGFAAMFAVGILVSDSYWLRHSLMTSLLKGAGQCLVVAAVLGRLWSTLYIGGRKNASLVITGPYSLSRNPLYLFSTLGAVGAGLAFGSAMAALLLGGATYFILCRTARREAELLSGHFGSTYVAYAKQVPLLWPRFSRYEETEAPSFDPYALGRTLRDALLFLLVLPAAELAGYAKGAGLLPRLIPLF